MLHCGVAANFVESCMGLEPLIAERKREAEDTLDRMPIHHRANIERQTTIHSLSTSLQPVYNHKLTYRKVRLHLWDSTQNVLFLRR